MADLVAFFMMPWSRPDPAEVDVTAAPSPRP
jgi:hypothetical protein